MILRPVRPQSPSGPPTTKAPVGLMCQTVLSLIHSVGSALADIGLDDLADVGGGLALVQVLGGEHDLGGFHRLAVRIAQRDLALGVGAQGRLLAGVARRRPAACRILWL